MPPHLRHAGLINPLPALANSAARYRASYYNLRVRYDTKTLLFNGVTGALLRLDARLNRAIEPWLGPERPRSAGLGYAAWTPPVFSIRDLPKSVAGKFDDFLEAGVFVPEARDERAMLRDAYVKDRAGAPFFVTITTTLDCNMRCYYCYQKEGELQSMSPDMCDAIAAWTKAQVVERGHRHVYVDWYGGEPMLNQDVIERYTANMIEYCDTNGVGYSAAMVCNGTAWPDDKPAFVARNRIKNIQFSIDGPERHHNKRRGIIGESKTGRSPSFQTVMDTIGALVGSAKIYLRINVDPWVGWDCLEVLDECAARGWMAPDVQVYPYVAIINAMTEHCGFIGKIKRFEDFDATFSDIQRAFYEKIGRFRGSGKSFEAVQYYPNRIEINCAAVSHNAVVFGPNGRMYKCGLDVGDDHRAHAALALDGASAPVSATEGPPALAADRWDRYDPFRHDRCSECQYLPVCMGGCPKAQIERDEPQLRLQSEFWENNFDRIVREYFRASGGH
jgi:uncharacterized protein